MAVRVVPQRVADGAQSQPFQAVEGDGAEAGARRAQRQIESGRPGRDLLGGASASAVARRLPPHRLPPSRPR